MSDIKKYEMNELIKDLPVHDSGGCSLCLADGTCDCEGGKRARKLITGFVNSRLSGLEGEVVKEVDRICGPQAAIDIQVFISRVRGNDK